MRGKRGGKLFKLNCCERSERKIFGKFCTFPPNSSKLRSDYLFSFQKSIIIYFQHFQGQNIYFQLEPQGALIAHLSSILLLAKFKGKKFDYRMEPKKQHFITHAYRSLLWIQFVAVAFQSEEEVFWRRGPPPPPLGKYGQNIFMHVPGPEHFIPTKFRKHPLSGSVVKTGYVFPYIYMH